MDSPGFEIDAEGSSTMIRRPSGAVFITSTLDNFGTFWSYAFEGLDTTHRAIMIKL